MWRARHKRVFTEFAPLLMGRRNVVVFQLALRTLLDVLQSLARQSRLQARDALRERRLPLEQRRSGDNVEAGIVESVPDGVRR